MGNSLLPSQDYSSIPIVDAIDCINTLKSDLGSNTD